MASRGIIWRLRYIKNGYRPEFSQDGISQIKKVHGLLLKLFPRTFESLCNFKAASKAVLAHAALLNLLSV